MATKAELQAELDALKGEHSALKAKSEADQSELSLLKEENDKLKAGRKEVGVAGTVETYSAQEYKKLKKEDK